jgi:4-amino-4-deoxychorismate lyase
MTVCLRVSPDRDPQLVAVDADVPQVSVLDLGVTRGDGVFEVLTVVDGRPQAVGPHLRRLANSAAMMDLPPVDLELIGRAARRVADAEYRASHAHELLVKVVVTRGIEDAAPPSCTCWVIAFPNPDHSRERREGIDVVTLDRGFPHDIAARAPWLLAGAKTLSYAVNKAALREAARRGADDVLFTSSDGYVLEGPSSSLLARFGTRMWTPATAQGVLRGTTQGSAFEYLGRRGFATGEALLRAEALEQADALWLASSSRLIAPIRTLDGRALSVDHGLTDAMNEALLARTE